MDNFNLLSQQKEFDRVYNHLHNRLRLNKGHFRLLVAHGFALKENAHMVKIGKIINATKAMGYCYDQSSVYRIMDDLCKRGLVTRKKLEEKYWWSLTVSGKCYLLDIKNAANLFQKNFNPIRSSKSTTENTFV